MAPPQCPFLSSILCLPLLPQVAEPVQGDQLILWVSCLSKRPFPPSKAAQLPCWPPFKATASLHIRASFPGLFLIEGLFSGSGRSHGCFPCFHGPCNTRSLAESDSATMVCSAASPKGPPTPCCFAYCGLMGSHIDGMLDLCSLCSLIAILLCLCKVYF